MHRLHVVKVLLYTVKYVYCCTTHQTTIECMWLIPGALMYLNEATLLNNVRLRYSRNAIYVSVLLLLLTLSQVPLSGA
jgi:hypothetical protein